MPKAYSHWCECTVQTIHPLKIHIQFNILLTLLFDWLMARKVLGAFDQCIGTSRFCLGEAMDV